MTLAVNVEGTKRALGKLAEGIRDAAWGALSDALEAAEASAKLAISSSTKTHTGTLLRSFDRFRSPLGMVGRLVNRAPYARYIDEGTKPHTIRARTATFLRFTMGGTVVYRRSVNHPGTAPRPFVSLAMASGQMALRDGLRRRTDAAAKAFNQ